ncbi:MAG: GNAT family N-acetyltransferase, partial [Acidimicrobiales bacterium]|nr:GNAT family N-acetyltransferase [Acidimicrobiales bacterium]
MTVIRDAIEADMAAVTDIYNSYLSTTTAAWSEREQTIDERIEWFRSRRSAG